MDPNQHPDVLRLRARGDQLRSGVREEGRGALFELDAPAQGQLLRECAAGDLSVFDEHVSLLIGTLAAVAVLDILETRDREEA